ncbi:MAG: MAPEG family protein [Halioglobus sp.]|nr:MAPEG family protein [Halioglobus sp.]
MPITTDILAPVVALLLWTSVMWAWMLATRIPAIQKAGMQMDPMLPVGQQTAELPARVRWKADNYNHLMEQPTLFYAVAITLALLGAGTGLNLTLAWAYVILRVVHSLQQALWNKIEVRFLIFLLYSLVLIALIVRAAMALPGLETPRRPGSAQVSRCSRLTPPAPARRRPR